MRIHVVGRAASQPLADLPGPVGGVPADHEMDLVAGEPVREPAHHLRGEALDEDRGVYPALGANRRHRVRREPIPKHRRRRPPMGDTVQQALRESDLDPVLSTARCGRASRANAVRHGVDTRAPRRHPDVRPPELSGRWGPNRSLAKRARRCRTEAGPPDALTFGTSRPCARSRCTATRARPRRQPPVVAAAAVAAAVAVDVGEFGLLPGGTNPGDDALGVPGGPHTGARPGPDAPFDADGHVAIPAVTIHVGEDHGAPVDPAPRANCPSAVAPDHTKPCRSPLSGYW